jgi:hypothetical protein
MSVAASVLGDSPLSDRGLSPFGILQGTVPFRSLA